MFFCLLLLLLLLDPQPWPEGSYELAVRPFVLPSLFPSTGSFLGIGSLVFSETQHGVRGPCAVHGRARFFEKNIFATKNDFFEIYWKI